MKHFKLEKLDGRHNNHKHYSHRVWVRGANYRISYYKLYRWCIQQFGPGIDVRMIRSVFPNSDQDRTHPMWAYWVNEGLSCYIYIRDEALTMFLLNQDSLEKALS